MRSVARWCVRHRWVVIGTWLLVLAGTFLGSTITSSSYATSTTISGTPSAAAASLLQRAVPGQSGDTEQIVYQTKTGTVDNPAVRAQITAMLDQVSHLRYVSGVTSPYSPAGAKQISAGKTVAFATVNFTKDANSIPAAEATTLVNTARAPNSANLQVDVVGDVAASTAPTSSLSTPIGIVAALIVLLLFFGALLPALVPLVSAIIAVMSGLAIVDMLSNSVSMASFTSQLCILIGLGVGIDYSLFILTRTRNGLRRGLSVEDAVTTAAGTAGRAVLFAGMTVCIALLGILTVGVSTLSGAAIAASIAVAFAVIAALTLLPALMSLLGMRLLTRRQRRDLARGKTDFSEASRGWGRWAALVQRNRLVLGIGALGVMIALGAPYLSMRQGTADYSVDPTSTTTTTYRGYEMLVHGFGPGFSGPLQLVAPLASQADKAAFSTVVAAADHTPGVVTTIGPEFLPAGPGHPAVALAEVYPVGSPQDRSTVTLVNDLRGTVIPDALRGQHLQVLVGGQTAIGIDVASQLSSKLPLFVGMVVALSFILLMVVFRSLTIPATAAIMNLLSASAAFGVITAVFQWGWLKSLVGVTNTGPVSPFIPILMFAVLFGLTTDYQVFLVSRIQEEWLRRRDNPLAVRIGQATSGRVISAAAAIMTVVFLAFTLTTDRTVKMIGLGMAAAILADALVVRTVLVPAAMHTLGKANWHIPSVLDRVLPRFNLEGGTSETADGADERIPEAASEMRSTVRLCRGDLGPGAWQAPGHQPFPHISPASLGGRMSTTLINHLLQSYGYIAVFLFVGLESMGVPLPGETMLIAAAVYAGSTHHLNIAVVGLVAAVAAVAGDNAGFWLGKHGGAGLVRRYGRWVRLDARKLKVGRYLFDRHGGKIVFFGRFTVVLRTYAAFLAGLNGMRRSRFFAANAAAAVLWSAGWASGAYALGSAATRVGSTLTAAGLGAVAVLAVALTVAMRRSMRRLEQRADALSSADELTIVSKISKLLDICAIVYGG